MVGAVEGLTVRQQVAFDLIAAVVEGILLWQVACEFVAASRKLSGQGLTTSQAWSRLSQFLGVLQLALPTAGILQRAQDLHVKRYQLGAHTKHDLKVHLVWVPKYRKRVLTEDVAVRVRDLIRQIAMEHEIGILSGKVASDHIHVLVAYRPHVDVSTIVQWLKGISSRILLQEFPHLRKAFWGRHFWARGYLAVSTRNLTDEMVQAYIAQQEGEPVHDDSRFVIDNSTKLPPSRR